MKINLRENTYKGKLIVFEGTDGAGKTTLISKTKEYLESKYGVGNVLVTKQPTDMSRKTKLFQKMMYCDQPDSDYRAVQLLTLSDRIQHNYEEIEPALKDDKIVICDRYVYTSIANMLARKYLNEDWFFQACDKIIKPDIVFLAYINPEKAIERIKSRPAECLRHLDEPLLKNVAEEFIKLKGSEDFCYVSTDRDPQEAFSDIKRQLDERIIK